jgi:hypothetical protein
MDITKTVDKMNKPRAFELGDPVIHKLTKVCGFVEAVERIGGADYQTLVVRLLNGNYMRGIRSTEFGLNSGLQRTVAAALDPRTAQQAEAKAGMAFSWDGSAPTGPVSDRSILDEIC